MSYLKVKGHSNLVRDTESHAIINTNRSTYELYMKKQMQRRRQQDELRDTVREINNLKNEMYEIKQLLKKVVG
jgi:hypothetical protein